MVIYFFSLSLNLRADPRGSIAHFHVIINHMCDEDYDEDDLLTASEKYRRQRCECAPENVSVVDGTPLLDSIEEQLEAPTDGIAAKTQTVEQGRGDEGNTGGSQRKKKGPDGWLSRGECGWWGNGDSLDIFRRSSHSSSNARLNMNLNFQRKYFI